MKLTLFFLFALVLQTSPSALASKQSEKYLTEFLVLFEKNPQRALNKIPPKYDQNGQMLKRSTNKFPADSIKNLEYVRIKDSHRQNLCPATAPGESCVQNHMSTYAAIDYRNDVKLFFENEPFVKNLSETNLLLQSRVSTLPWSGDYWGTYRAGIAARYNDPEYPRSENFKDYYSFYEKNKSIDYSNAKLVDNLSPAEKYDLLVNDQNMSLTNYSVSDAYFEWKSSGKIETWFGLCHGWAPASYMLRRPTKTVDIYLSAQNITLRFYPDDIKALATILWANAAPETNMIGGRCNDKEPKRDDNGRITSENCFDINPGSWHLAVVNQMGKYKRSMVIDATYDYEVWNQPVVDYSYTYFNPVNKRLSRNLSDVQVDIKKYTKDPFKKYRDEKTKSIVGVSMELTYVKETDASHATTDSANNDYRTTVQYVYDLEIDENGEVIGGEWYQNAHPDFIWTPAPEARALSSADQYLIGEWTGKNQPPAEWTTKIREASKYGQPAAKVIEHLIELAK